VEGWTGIHTVRCPQWGRQEIIVMTRLTLELEWAYAAWRACYNSIILLLYLYVHKKNIIAISYVFLNLAIQ